MSSLERECLDFGWHKNGDYLEQLRKFHDKFARQPDMKEARFLHNQILTFLETDLKNNNLCKRLIFAGSAYDGLKVGRSSEPDGMDDLEFDVMIVIGDDMVDEHLCGTSSSIIVKLKPREECKNALVLNGTLNGEYICPNKLISTYMSKLQKCLNNLKEIHSQDGQTVTCKLKKHGPAIQLDVMKGSHVIPYFSVDLVPTFQNTDQNNQIKYFVAKPGLNDDEKFNFRRSFGVQEKELLKAIDSDNGCRRKLTRILKEIFKREPTLNVFSSYIVKSTMLHLTKEKNEPKDWREEKMFDRFIDFFKLLYKFVSEKQMPHYFFADENMPLKQNEISRVALENVRCRIKNILASENVMKTILKT